jgi:hypothetical protein
MGSPPRLKIKDEMRYRKGHTNESQNCRYCLHFTATPAEKYPYATVVPGACKVIGAHISSRYRVCGDHTCDRQEYDEKKRTW